MNAIRSLKCYDTGTRCPMPPMATLFTASIANSILFLFNIWWTIRMKCYLQWITKRSLHCAMLS